MEITFDPNKRDKTLRERGLDFLDAAKVFADVNYRWTDDRYDYGEVRTVTIGRLRGRMVVVVWTQRGAARHIISMRKANEREKTKYGKYLD
jgi:uncharacterized DUF497 family protein